MPVPEQVHTLSCQRAFPDLDDAGQAVPTQTRRIPHHHVSRGRVLLDPVDKGTPGDTLRVVCGKATVHNNNYRFETGLKWSTTNVVGSLIHFPPRPNVLGYLAIEMTDLDNPTYTLFSECVEHVRGMLCRNNFPAGSKPGRVIYRLFEDASRTWLPFSPAHCLWVATDGSGRQGAFVS